MVATNWDDFELVDPPAPKKAAANSSGSVDWDQFELVSPAGAESSGPGGFVASAKQSIGSAIKGAGQAAADFIPGVDQDNAVKQYGQGVIDANPTAVKSLGDIADKPGTALKEAVGNAAGSMGPMLGARALGMGITAAAPLTGPLAPITAAVGQGVAWLGPAAAAALPSFGGIREQQIKDDPSKANDFGAKARAATGAAAVGAIESKFGPQEWALGALSKEGRAKLAEKFAANTLGGSVAKGAVTGAAVEGAEELVQNPIEQIAAYQDPATAENVQDTLFGGAMGAIGGGVLGGGFGGVSRSMVGDEKAPGAAPAEAGGEKPGAVPLALPAPTYTGTPGEQILQAEAERQNLVDEAQARANDIYQRRHAFEAARTPVDPAPDLSPVRESNAARLDALSQQEAGEPDVPQTTPPNGRAILDARRNAEIAAGRAMVGPDDEILQSIGAADPPHRAMGIDPAAGPLSTGAAIAVDSGVHAQMQAAAQTDQGQPAGPLAGAVQGVSERAQPVQADGHAARWDAMTAQERADAASRSGLPPVIASNILRADWATLNPDLQSRIAKTMTPATSSIEGVELGDGWKAFTPESGTLSVPRAEMPQIKAEHRGAMTNFMNARGVAHAAEEVPADSLRPTQAEFSPAKVKKALGYTGGDRSILVSSDNYVLDGHHQWLAKREAGAPVKVIRLNAPIRQLIDLAHEFPSSSTTGGSAAATGPGDRGRAAAAADDLRAMSQDAGWSERGGLLIRDGAGNPIGRTKWLPRAEWFMAGMEADPATLARDIDRHINGEKVPVKSLRTIDGMLEWLNAQRSTALDENSSAAEWEAIPVDELSAEERSAYEAIEAAIDNPSPLSVIEELRWAGYTEEEIRAELEAKEGSRSGRKADAAAEEKRAEKDSSGPQRQTPGSFLEAYSEQDLAQRDAAQRDADTNEERAQREADQKIQADAERDAFALTGSDRTADVLSAQGQGGLFDQTATAAPKPQAAPTKADLDTRWDSFTAEQRAAILIQPGGWATAAGGLNVIGKQLARKSWGDISDGTRSTIKRLMEKAHNQKSTKSESRGDSGPVGEKTPVDQESDDSLDIRIGDAQKVIDAAPSSAPGRESQSALKGEAAQPVAEQPAVGEALSPLEAIFSDLNSDSTRKANKARRAAAKLPEAARIEYVQANFHDMLIQMMDAGVLEVNGAATLTEDNKPCL